MFFVQVLILILEAVLANINFNININGILIINHWSNVDALCAGVCPNIATSVGGTKLSGQQMRVNYCEVRTDYIQKWNKKQGGKNKDVGLVWYALPITSSLSLKQKQPNTCRNANSAYSNSLWVVTLENEIQNLLFQLLQSRSTCRAASIQVENLTEKKWKLVHWLRGNVILTKNTWEGNILLDIISKSVHRATKFGK